MPTLLLLGATSDIGLAIARQFAAKGYNIQLAARDPLKAAPAAKDLSIRFGIQTTVYPFNAGSPQEHASFFDSLVPKPDVSVYVIGYLGAQDKAFSDPAETTRIVESNYTGAISIFNIIAAYYAGQKNGTLVGISSVAGDRGRQSNFIYGSAKAAFSTYLDGLRNYLFRFGVHVVTVKPGFVYTRMTENLPLPPALTTTPEAVAQGVWKAVDRKQNTLYVKWVWRWIMMVIQSIPEFMFKKMKL